MVVLMVDSATAALRGLLSRWMVQPRAGVFVGRLSARVRDKLWEMVVESGKAQGALMIHGAQTEQGFRIRSWGTTERCPVDFDGLTLIRRPTRSKEHARRYGKRERGSRRPGEDGNGE